MPPGRHSDGGGLGLHLLVKPSGARSWFQRVHISGKQRDIGHGAYPVVTLSVARSRALDAKRAIEQGRDPIKDKREAKESAARRLTFSEASQHAHAELQSTWKNPKDRAAFLTTLETYAGPYFGDSFIDELTSADVRRAILKCRETRPGIAKKLNYRIAAVFRWALAEGLCEVNPAHPASLALPKMTARVTHNRSLPYSEVPKALSVVDKTDAWLGTKLALRFTVLTACRSGEVRGAKWEEMSVSDRVWVIPAGRMKMGREHRVPLSGPAISVLSQAQSLGGGTGLVFPSARGKELSDNTLSKLLRENSVGTTVHGFRASFRTWCQEQTSFPPEVAEQALAHAKADKVEAAYARSELFEKRYRLMADWASFVTSLDWAS